jgi:hypothetical protein
VRPGRLNQGLDDPWIGIDFADPGDAFMGSEKEAAENLIMRSAEIPFWRWNIMAAFRKTALAAT